MLISVTLDGTMIRMPSAPTGAIALTPPGPAPPRTRSTRSAAPWNSARSTGRASTSSALATTAVARYLAYPRPRATSSSE